MASAATTSSTTTGTLLETGDGMIVVGIPGTDYRLHLRAHGRVTAPLGKPISGRITARARRVDPIRCGGRFIEPVYGRPRRIQGAVQTTDRETNTITVKCGGGCLFVCELVADQKTDAFAVGTLVGFDVERGACFEFVTED